jgi:hypothetical protein
MVEPVTNRRATGVAWCAVAMLVVATCAVAQDDVTGGAIVVEPTYQHLGVLWRIAGDDDLDASCSLRFRRQGDAAWRPGLGLVRTHPGITGEGGAFPDNRFAGSVFFLEPGAAYELELSLVDPDGGSETRTVVASTATELAWPVTPRDLFVVPGGGGGSGAPGDPFLGLQAAADAAQPGDVFHLAAGRYAPFTLLTSGAPGSPIVFTGPVDPTRHADELAWAIVDGAGTPRGVLQIGELDFDTSYVIVERLAIENGEWGVDAQRTQHVTLRRCVLRDVSFGYYNRRDAGTESDQLVSDCVFAGRNAWPDVGIPPERAIDLRGTRNTIRYCRIDHFGDGASIQPFTSTNALGNDVHGNDISYIVDDPIEVDSAVANVRVWGNRVVNGRMGVSLAPIYGGPAYVFRNDFFNLEISAYKMNREPSGLVIFHNSSAKVDDGTSSTAGWQNTLLRNNVLLGTRYVFEEYGLVAGSVDDWDFDALGTTAVPFAKWDNIRYQDLADLRANSGIEASAVACALGDLESAALPLAYTDGVPIGAPDLRLRPGVPAVDSGQVLPNVNDPFVSDGRPDCGAHELGSSAPPLTYGPRSRVLLVLEVAGTLPSIDLFTAIVPRQDCPGGLPETSGAIDRTCIPADAATATLDLPEPAPLRLSGAGEPGGAALTLYEIEDSSAVACTPGTALYLARDASRRPADLLVSWR